MEQDNLVVTIEDFDGNILEIKNIPHQEFKKKPEYLNTDLVNELREAVNSSPIFWKDEKYHSFYNQVCAAMDRLGTAMDYLNKHRYYPKSEDKFICFMAFACMIVDAPKMLAKKINAFITAQGIADEYKVKLPFEKDKALFKKICMKAPFNMTEKECPTDDEFFAFFRSITFAHPYYIKHRISKSKAQQVIPIEEPNAETTVQTEEKEQPKVVSTERKKYCPRCHSRLVKRHGPYGDFYGCESYGKTGCRYTRKFL